MQSGGSVLTEQDTVLPWQKKNWHKLETAYQVNRLAHAILFSGAVGMGLNHFAERLVKGLLCDKHEQALKACGDCRSCYLFQVQSHPDLLNISPEASGKQIGIDAIRRLTDFIRLKAHYGRYKISIITPAEAMSRGAMNALLKTLEEPTQDSLLVMLSHKPSLLPITIKSRCQQLLFAPAFDDNTVAWLERSEIPNEDVRDLLAIANGAPLMVEAMLKDNMIEHRAHVLRDILERKGIPGDPVKIAEQWKAYDVPQVLLWLSQLLVDMIRIKARIQTAIIKDPETISCLQVLAKRLQLKQLLLFYDLLLEKYHLSNATISYDVRGLLEDVIISWQCLIGTTTND